MTTTSERSLDERYGRTPSSGRRNRTIGIVVAAVFAVVLVSWVVWAGLIAPGASLETRDVGHTVVDDHTVIVEFGVTTEPRVEVSCVVEALNESFGVVGWKQVDLPVGDQRDRVFTETLRTSEPAVTGLIYKCWLP